MGDRCERWINRNWVKLEMTGDRKRRKKFHDKVRKSGYKTVKSSSVTGKSDKLGKIRTGVRRLN